MDNVIEIFHNVIHRIINDAGEEAAKRRGRRVAVRQRVRLIGTEVMVDAAHYAPLGLSEIVDPNSMRTVRDWQMKVNRQQHFQRE